MPRTPSDETKTAGPVVSSSPSHARHWNGENLLDAGGTWPVQRLTIDSVASATHELIQRADAPTALLSLAGIPDLAVGKALTWRLPKSGSTNAVPDRSPAKPIEILRNPNLLFECGACRSRIASSSLASEFLARANAVKLWKESRNYQIAALTWEGGTGGYGRSYRVRAGFIAGLPVVAAYEVHVTANLVISASPLQLRTEKFHLSRPKAAQADSSQFIGISRC